jgi:hypothetical protein
MKTTFQVRPAGPRPDFRLVVTFLWSEMHNVDSDGNSLNPASKDWTELYLMNREKRLEVVQVYPLQEKPLILVVESEVVYFAARTAFFLARETNGDIIDQEGRCCSYEVLCSQLGEGFDVVEALRRADASVWRQATLEHPYPNLSRQ